MKLSTANLSQKLQTIKPVKKIAGRLKKSAGVKSADKRNKPETAMASSDKQMRIEESLVHKGKSRNVKSVPGFIQNSKLVQNSKSARVAFHLLLVKPWVLVVGLWLISALSALVALEGLISPRKLTADLPEATVEVAPSPKTNSFIKVEQSAEGIAGDESEAAAEVTESTEVANSGAGLPIWPLVMLVGSCAAGCVVISRRRAMLRMSARTRRGRKPQLGKKLSTPIGLRVSNGKPNRRSAASANKQASVAAFKATARSEEKAKPVAGGTREKKRRQRKRSGASLASSNPPSKKRVLISRSTAQQAVPQSRISQPGKTSKRPRQKVARLVRRQPVVSVVPANHSNRLDWVDGSLAHDMDRRFAMEELSRKRAAM